MWCISVEVCVCVCRWSTPKWVVKFLRIWEFLLPTDGWNREDEHQKGVYLRIVWRRSEIRQIYSVIVLNFATVDVHWGYLYHPFFGSQDATLLGAVWCRTEGDLSYSAWTLALTVPLKGPLLEPRNVERTIVGFTSFFVIKGPQKNILKHFAVIHQPSAHVWTRTMCIFDNRKNL